MPVIKKLNESKIGKRKAAIFLISVGPIIAAKILSAFTEPEVETLMVEVANCSMVSQEEKETIMEEFYEDYLAKDSLDKGGINFATEVLEKAFGKIKAEEMIERLSENISVGPFNFLRNTEPDHLVTFIKSEHPQTIALILTYLNYDQASKVLCSLRPELQTEVAKRIAVMDRTTPEVISRVEKILEKKISTIAGQDLRIVGGVKAIVGILNNVDRGTEKVILNSFEKANKALAAEVKSMMFVFEDVLKLDDKAVQRVLKEIDTNVLSLAMKNASRELRDKIFKNMSERSADILQEDMEVMGPSRVTDIEKAQVAVVAKIKELDDSGEIVIARGDSEKLV
jgi:flagellar motor switch protein FliG